MKDDEETRRGALEDYAGLPPAKSVDEVERRRKHRKAFEDFAADLPKPGPDGLIPRRR